MKSALQAEATGIRKCRPSLSLPRVRRNVGNARSRRAPRYLRWMTPAARTNRSLRRERQQHVPAEPLPQVRVSRIGEDHAVRDDRSWAVERTALARHTVHGVEVASGVELPEDVAVGRR